MKKTLTLLSLLALGVFSAQAATLSTVSFNRTGNTIASTTVHTLSSYDLITSSIQSFSKGGNPAGGQAGDLLGQGTIPSSVVVANSNVSTGGSWSMSFTFTNTGTSNLLISSIDLSLIGVTGGGDAQNTGGGVADPTGSWVGGLAGASNKPVDMTMSLGGNSQMLTYNVASGDGGAGNWNTLSTGSYNFMDGMVLAAGDSLTMTISAARNSAYTAGTFVGLSGIKLNGEALAVPEPATTSLGLLGLAVLVLRRRRV